MTRRLVDPEELRQLSELFGQPGAEAERLVPSRPRSPCAQAGPALNEMLAQGESRQPITDLVRVFQ